MRNLITTGLLVLVFFSQLGYHAIYSIQQAIIRHEQKIKMLSEVDESELDRFPEQKDMIFMEEGREFYLHGELYDVVKTKKSNGRTIYYAINDKKESTLLKKLANTTKNQSQNSAEKKGGLTIQLLFCEDISTAISPDPSPVSPKNPAAQDMRGDAFAEIILPPPNTL